MEVQRPDTVKNPPEWFTGDVWLDPIAAPTAPGQQATSAVWGDHVTDAEYDAGDNGVGASAEE
jgi:hypothetical protein